MLVIISLIHFIAMKKFLRYTFLLFAALLLLVVLYVGMNWKKDVPLEALKAKYAPAPSQFISVDGLDVHYRDEGNPADSVPLVLIHGTSSSLHTWQGWTDALKEEHRIVRFDLPGFGLTGPNATGDYSVAYYTAFTREVLEKLHISRCVIGGNSLGGDVAWRFCVEYPGVAQKLILVDAAGYPNIPINMPIGFRLAQIPVLRMAVRFVTPQSVIEQSVQSVYGDKSKVTAELVDRYYDLTLRAGNRQALIDRMKNGYPTDEDYRKIHNIAIPALILWGAQDGLIPESAAERFHADLPNDTLVVLNGLGHVPMEEDPARTAAVVKAFLKKS